MPELVIRPASLEDADPVFALLLDFVTSYTPERVAFDRHLPLLIDGDDAVILVAESDGDVVGYVLGHIALTLFANGPVMELQELMVTPPRRGEGIGRKLVEAAMKIAAAAQCTEVTVPTRRAQDFYMQLGFEETATYLKRRIGQPAIS